MYQGLQALVDQVAGVQEDRVLGPLAAQTLEEEAVVARLQGIMEAPGAQELLLLNTSINKDLKWHYNHQDK
jgi:hypothetical protein